MKVRCEFTSKDRAKNLTNNLLTIIYESYFNSQDHCSVDLQHSKE